MPKITTNIHKTPQNAKNNQKYPQNATKWHEMFFGAIGDSFWAVLD